MARDKDQTVDANDQVVRTVPGTDLGGHDTAGVDGKDRTERPGSILGTPNPDSDAHQRSAEARARETAKGDFVTAEVDRANREDLPKLGGPVEDAWEPTDAKGKVVKAALPEAPSGEGNDR